MKRTSKELVDYVSGKHLDKEYLLEVTGVFYDLTVEEYFKSWEEPETGRNALREWLAPLPWEPWDYTESLEEMKLGNALLWSSKDGVGDMLSNPWESLRLITYGFDEYIFKS